MKPQPQPRGRVVGRLTWECERLDGPMVTLCLDAGRCPLPNGCIESVDVRRADIVKGYARPRCDLCGAELSAGAAFSRAQMREELEELAAQVDDARDRLRRALASQWSTDEARHFLGMARNALDEARSYLNEPAPPRGGPVELRVGAYALRPGQEPELTSK